MDIMRCVDKIVSKYLRSVQDYAVWYREKNMATDTNFDFAPLYACHILVHSNSGLESDFVSPNTTWEVGGGRWWWEVVKFSD